MHGRAVEKAVQHYIDNGWSEVRTVDQLEMLLSNYPDDKDGNTEIAQILWGNKHWTRVGLLRSLVVFFKERNVTNQDALREWAAGSDYDRDFKGKIRGMGMAIYNWLVMRQGIEKVKPDVHLHRFVRATLGRPVSDAELVSTLQQVARLMSLTNLIGVSGNTRGARAGPSPQLTRECQAGRRERPRTDPHHRIRLGAQQAVVFTVETEETPVRFGANRVELGPGGKRW